MGWMAGGPGLTAGVRGCVRGLVAAPGVDARRGQLGYGLPSAVQRILGDLAAGGLVPQRNVPSA